MFRKQIILFLALILALSIFSLQAQASLSIGVDRWAPYEFKVNDELTGFATEMVEEVLEQMNVDIEGQIETYPFTRLLEYILNGNIDAAFSLVKNEERAVLCYYPEEPLVVSSWLLYVRKDRLESLAYEDLEDLRGRSVGIVRSYSYPTDFMNFVKQEENYSEAGTDEQNFRMLEAGRLDFVVAEGGNASSILKKMSLIDTIIPLSEHPLSTEGFYIIFNKANVTADFVDRFSHTLKTFKTSENYGGLYKKYF